MIPFGKHITEKLHNMDKVATVAPFRPIIKATLDFSGAKRAVSSAANKAGEYIGKFSDSKLGKGLSYGSMGLYAMDAGKAAFSGSSTESTSPTAGKPFKPMNWGAANSPYTS